MHKSDLTTLPKVRSRANLPESQLKTLDRAAKREVLSKLKEELGVFKHMPDPPILKQIDIEDNYEVYIL